MIIMPLKTYSKGPLSIIGYILSKTNQFKIELPFGITVSLNFLFKIFVVFFTIYGFFFKNGRIIIGSHP